MKDKYGDILERIPVTEVAGWEKFEAICKAWGEHPSFNGEPKETE